MRLSLYEFAEGVETADGVRVVYDFELGTAFYGAAKVDGAALVWELEDGSGEGALLSREIELDASVEWIVRCDRVDFPAGGIAYLHTHPGPGIRYLLHGSLEVHTAGRSTVFEAGGAWFESGPDPVLALAAKEVETAFVRVLLLPREREGKRTIRYLDLADEAKPKLQRATVFLEQLMHL